MTSKAVKKYGRIEISKDGITQNSVLGFGKKFYLRWDQITQWSTTEMLKAYTATGQQEVTAFILQLHTPDEIVSISRNAKDKNYALIVEQLRKRLPHLETQSMLTKLNDFRN